jgi:hypothetical protein
MKEPEAMRIVEWLSEPYKIEGVSVNEGVSRKLIWISHGMDVKGPQSD